MSKIHLPHGIQDTLYITVGALFMAFALKSFLVPNGFLDGGVTGLSLLLHESFHTNDTITALLLVAANMPLIVMGYFLVGKSFVIKTSVGVVLLALCFTLIPFPHLSIAAHYDRILLALFGGFFLGIGVGLGMRGGCALDGIEVLALYTLRRSSFTISEIILGINAVLFLLAAFIVGFDVALYAILTYYVATRTIDFVIEGLEEYTGVTIISGCSEEIKQRLVKELNRGITIYKGKRGFLKDSYDISVDADIVFTIVTRLEVRRMRNLILKIDPRAFIFTHSIKEASGGVLSRRVHH